MQNIISLEKKRELCRLMAFNLPVLRKKANLSQEKIGALVGLSRITISKIERGKTGMQWNCFLFLITYFIKDEETKSIMIAMGFITDDVIKALHIDTL